MSTEDKIQKLLDGRMLTVHEIASRSGASLRTVHRVLARLRASGSVYIAAWAQSAERKYPVPAYRSGRGMDAPKPERRTPAEYQRAWRERKVNT